MPELKTAYVLRKISPESALQKFLAPFLVALLLFTFSCGESTGAPTAADTSLPDTIPGGTIKDSDLFGVQDAQWMIQAGAQRTESSHNQRPGRYTLNMTFTAIHPDENGDTANVYFMFTEFDNIDSAKSSYDGIARANADHEGIEQLEGYGDEAYFHSDGENFYFLLMRKGHKEVRLKLNKIISTSTRDNFLAMAKKVAGKL